MSGLFATNQTSEDIDRISAARESAIEIRDVSKRFKLFADRRTNLKEMVTDRRRKDRSDEFWALRDISLDIPRGKTFGLIGHNGSGKSTLLKLIAGIHRPTKGSVVAHGRVSAMLELGAGFHPELSGRENVYLNGSILGMTRKQIDRAMERIVDFSGLSEFIDTPVKIYSSGMYVRLGFAIAVNLDPEILIVDEVIAVGDEEFQRKCFDHLYDLRRRGTTIVMVSHSLGLMAEICDEVAWIDSGRLRGVGPARKLTDEYLASVNIREAESAQGISHESPAYGSTEVDPSRHGSGEVQVTDIEYLDAEGSSVAFLTSGQSCTLRVHYSASAEISSVALGLSFDHESGAHIADTNSGYDNGSSSLQAGRGHFDYRMDRLPLLPGAFTLSTLLSDKGHTYDSRERAFIMKVRAAESNLGSGLVRFEGLWTGPGSS
ncbi:ABC-2 type transport system ATP-binding protein/lipopolysaccharide transport system ATP-binding protein [Antricoccus suffuscus]|uniref:ABC-2 type transport system ATP-binding protein/lipopolysaccharide transport system ATP-binding protein n=1 Tax=Antricoccus suffuscus TaxID=1629062 RepID=A0A2T1A6X7_9ACTN|nr:ABC transporter ATP-binding protein [Antricoccus suffuscus]PRZ44365.1 ABC-2 type transport system ATP-binding protein/lipopolysaccharide transport system ATP-binding protein [Antricoccus suffuscus]